jgi:hypothetical protein
VWAILVAGPSPSVSRITAVVTAPNQGSSRIAEPSATPRPEPDPFHLLDELDEPVVPLTIEQDDEDDAQPPTPGPVALRASPAAPAPAELEPYVAPATDLEALAGPERRPRRRWLAGGLRAAVRVGAPPLLALVLAHALLGAAAVRAGGRPLEPLVGPAPSSAGASPSTPYLDIARGGYALAPCPGRPGAWCGSTAWFPLYPALVNVATMTGIGLRPAAAIVSETFALLALVLAWLMLGARASPASVLALALAALFPGVAVEHAALPFALVAFGTLACVLALGRGRWAVGGTAGAVAAASHPVGLLLIPLPLAWALLVRDGRLRARLARGTLAALLAAGGLAVVALAWQRQVGAWDAWLKVQAGAGQLRLHNPVATLRHSVTLGAPAVRLQSLTVTVIVLLAVGATLARRRVAPAGWALLATTTAVWLAWLVAAPRSPHHAAALLLPAAVLTRQLPRAAQLALVVAAAALAVATVPSLLHGTLL